MQGFQTPNYFYSEFCYRIKAVMLPQKEIPEKPYKESKVL